MSTSDLIERERDLARLSSMLERTRQGIGGVAVVEGSAGLGKSSVIGHLAAAAADAQFGVLRARGAELERPHSYGVVASLFAPLLRDNDPEAFRGPAERSRSVVLPDAGSTDATIDRQAALHALYWLVVNLSERQPVLLAIDDAHWADEASLRFVAYLAQRIADIRALMLIGLRPDEASRTEVGEQVRSHAAADRVVLRPLSSEGVAQLVARAPAGVEVDADDLWAITGGNPFYVIEMLRATEPTAADASAVPDAIRSSVRRRLAVAGRGARELAEAIAVLGDAATIRRLATLSGLAEPTVADLTRRMTEKAILEADALSFVHPILHAAVYDAMPTVASRRLHAAAAEMLRADGASSGDVAAQLMRAEPSGSAETVRVLRDAARAAVARGDADGATTLLRRALAEPPPGEMYGSVLLELAHAEAASGSPSAPERYEEAIGAHERADDRARARHAHGHALIGLSRWAEAAVVFRRGLAEADPGDVELRSRLEAGYVASAYVGLVDHGEAQERLQRILSAPLTDPSHRELAAWSAFQQTMAPGAAAPDVARLARRALRAADLRELIPASQVVELVAGVFLATEDLEEEVRLLDRAMEAATEIGAFGKLGLFSYCRSLPHLLSARIADAIADGQAARAAYEAGWKVFYPATCAALSWAFLETGDVEAAEEAVAIDDAEWMEGLDYQFMIRIARGRIMLARGRLPEAASQLELARGAGEALGVHTPTILGDWRTWYAVTLRRMGRRDEAVAVATEAVQLADRWQTPGARARAAWALGIAEGGPQGIASLERARALLEGSPLVLDRIRVVVDLGGALRRAGRTAEAREELRRAADLAQRSGALALLEQARAELAASGARTRRLALTGVASLTPSELRVARLVAEGRTNREVAEALFVTPKAVEYHLANAYRKLAIGSRTELPRALANGTAG